MPPITSVSSFPPDLARPERNVRDRQQLGSEVADQVQRALGARGSQAPLTAAPQQAGTTREVQQPRLQPPLDLVQRFFSERQAALRDAALQRDEILRQQDGEQQLRPIAQAQRESVRLQVLRDAQLLETQRLASQRLTPVQDTERVLAQRETQRLDEQRLAERTFERQDAARLVEQRSEERREAERVEERDEARRTEERRAEEAREQDRVEARREAERVETERVEAQLEATRLEEQRASEQVQPSQSVAAAERSIEARERRLAEIDNVRGPADAERAMAERAVFAYRSESQRAAVEADAARFEGAQPLNEQLRVARERIDAQAQDAQRIDRVDVSSAALSRLTF